MAGKAIFDEKLRSLKAWLRVENRFGRLNHVRARAGLRAVCWEEAIVLLDRMSPIELAEFKEYLK